MENLSDFCWKLINYITENRDDVLYCSSDTHNERLNTCTSCDKYDERDKQCLACGCFVPAKTRVIFESCPLDKWSPEKEEWDRKFPEIQQILDTSS